MRDHLIVGVLIGAVTITSGCAGTPIATPPPPQVEVTERQDSPHHLERESTIQVTAVVTDIDVDKRLVTLKGSDGNEETVKVGPEVRNLPQVRKGDQVIVTYYESTVFQLLKPGEGGKPGSGAGQVVGRAELGEKPAAAGAEAMTITATVMKVDKNKDKPSITLKSAEGKVVTLPVRDVSKLEPVKVGDLLEITYKQALAVSVETPPKNP